MIDLLVAAPVHDAQVFQPVDGVALDAVLAFELVQPARQQADRLPVAGIEPVREQPRKGGEPPGIVGHQPELDEGESRQGAHRAHAARSQEVRLDRAGACHGSLRGLVRSPI
jgi:hypothetical protein